METQLESLWAEANNVLCLSCLDQCTIMDRHEETCSRDILEASINNHAYGP